MMALGRCWPSAVNNPVPGALPGQTPPCERDFKGGFASKLMLKVSSPRDAPAATMPSFKASSHFSLTDSSRVCMQDLNLALNAAKTASVPLPLGSNSVRIYEEVSQDTELANRDFSVVFRWLQHQQNEAASKASSS